MKISVSIRPVNLIWPVTLVYVFIAHYRSLVLCSFYMHTYCRGSHTHTDIETHAQSQPSCRHSDLVVTHRYWLHSFFLLLLLFTKQRRALLSPRGERAKFTRGTQGISSAVVCWWTALLWLGTRGQAPKVCWILWCLCVCVFVFFQCVCWHLYVC